MMHLLEIYKIVLHKEVINLPSEWHWGVFTNILGIYQIEKSSEKCYGFWDSPSSWVINNIYNDNKKHQLPATECSTDNRQLHQATLSIQPILDKRLRTNIPLLQQVTEKKKIQQTNWINTSSQIANTLTKLGA